MNERPLPLTPEQVDELLSAELDGEFDAAAADIGFDSARARELLEASPNVAARRVALTRARDALVEVPEIDDLLGARLRAKAVEAARQEHGELERARRVRRVRRLTFASGALAAAIAAVFGIAAISHGDSANKVGVASPKANRSPVANGAAQTPTTQLTEGGKVKPSPSSAPGVFSMRPVAGLDELRQELAASDALRTEGGSFTTSLDAAAEKVAGNCDPSARAITGLGSAPAARARTTFAGTPVIVNVYNTVKGHLVLVLRDNCTLVTQLTLP
jgi:hypothetical protein